MLHSFQLNGYNIVMDVNSGAVHVVDGMVYDMIQLLDADFLARSFDSLHAASWRKGTKRFTRCTRTVSCSPPTIMSSLRT